MCIQEYREPGSLECCKTVHTDATLYCHFACGSGDLFRFGTRLRGEGGGQRMGALLPALTRTGTGARDPLSKGFNSRSNGQGQCPSVTATLCHSEANLDRFICDPQ
jgi:hypothetical protein